MRDTRRPVTDTVGCDNRCDNHPVQHRRDAKLAHARDAELLWYLGRAGRQLERVLLTVYKGGQAEDTEAAGLSPNSNPNGSPCPTLSA